MVCDNRQVDEINFDKRVLANIGRNPKTGERVPIAPEKVFFCKSGKELEERVDR